MKNLNIKDWTPDWSIEETYYAEMNHWLQRVRSCETIHIRDYRKKKFIKSKRK